MAITKYGVANESQGQLLAGIGASSPSLILKAGQGALFPPALECPFFIKLEKYDTALNNFRVLKREIAICTNRSGDTLTITRGAGYCPASYSATTQTNTAFSFDADDTVTQVLVGEQIEEIQVAIEALEDTKLDSVAGLATGYGVNKTKYIEPTTGNEVLKNTSVGTAIGDTELVLTRDPTSGDEKRTPFSVVKNSLSTAGKFIQSVPLGEAISAGTPTALAIVRSAVNFAATLGGNIAGARLKSGIRFTIPYDTTLGIVKPSQTPTSGLARIQLLDDTGGLVVEVAKKADVANAIPTLTSNSSSGYTVTTNYTSSPTNAYQVYDNNTGTSFYTTGETSKNIKLYLPAAARYNRISFYHTNTGMYYTSWTLYGIDEKGGETLLYTGGNTPNVLTDYTFTNNDKYVGYAWYSGGALGGGGSYPSIVNINFSYINPADEFDFLDQALVGGTTYRLVENDSTYFNANNNELALASYQTAFKFCISGTLNGNNSVEPQNIKEINIGTRRAMKMNTTSSNILSEFAGFAVGSKVKGDLVELDGNDGSVISGFTWLTENETYYATNTAGTISTTKGTIKSIIGKALSATQIRIEKKSNQLHTLLTVNIGTTSTMYHFGGELYFITAEVNSGSAPSYTVEYSPNGGATWKTYVSIAVPYIQGTTAAGNGVNSFDIPPGLLRITTVAQAVSILY